MQMTERHPADPVRFQRMTTTEIREGFLVEHLFTPGDLRSIYWHVDRAVFGSAAPLDKSLALTASRELAAEYFCQRREIGVMNVGDDGSITVDGKTYEMANRDCLYIGRGSKQVEFASADSSKPAMFYFISFPAHTVHPVSHLKMADAEPLHLGSAVQCNERTIYKYIHPDGAKSCQLVMGFTVLAEGSVWNTMPAHLHPRRSEIYMYFDIAPETQVFHFMGKPEETRHIGVGNRQVVMSPSWSIHSGVGTGNYSFIWAMGGENQDFSDIDGVPVPEVR